jgi:hypothetical protein
MRDVKYKMNKTDIIWIVATLTFSSTVGVWVLVRKIKQYTHTPTNVITRHNQDIELQNVIDPIQSIARDVDLSSLPQYPTSQAIINHVPIRWNQYYPPRYSEIIDNINCPLELEILDFLDWLIILFSILIFMTIFIYYKNIYFRCV